MGLLKIIRKVKQKEKEMRLLLLGLDNAGKSTVMKRFLGDDISKISPTLGFDIKTLEHKGYRLNLWDIGGQATIRAYWRNYFEETQGLIFVVDSSDKRRLIECRNELFKLLNEEKLMGATLLILANKQDLQGALTAEEIALVLELNTNKIFKNRSHKIIGCSALSGNGLVDGVNWVVDDIASHIFMLS